MYAGALPRHISNGARQRGDRDAGERERNQHEHSLVSRAPRLELQAKRELDLPGRTRRGQLPELRVHLVARRIELSGRVDAAELSVIKRVISLRSKLKFERLADGEIFENRKIPVRNSRPAQKGFARITKRADRGDAEAAGIEIFRECPLVAVEVRIAGDVDARIRRRRAADIRAVGRSE